MIVENNPFTYNISIPSSHYHLIPSYQWYCDGVAINTTTITNPDVSVYPEITFNPVVRTQSGNYSMTASTEGGDSTGYFILDVLGKLVALLFATYSQIFVFSSTRWYSGTQ